MTKTQFHLIDFYRLVEEAGSLTALVHKCGYDDSVSLSQLKRRLETQAEDESARDIRPSLAAKLEADMDKRKGWLSCDHSKDKEKAAARMTAKAAENFIMPSKVVIPTGGRFVTVTRSTRKTQITLPLNLDDTGRSRLDTGIPFLNHILDQAARHGMVDLEVTYKGDTYIDDHHTVEDIGAAFGRVLKQVLRDKAGIRRYRYVYVPLDESLSRMVLDLSDCPGLIYNTGSVRAWIGWFDMDLFSELFHGIANYSMMTLHIDNLRDNNAHRQAETVSKASGRALHEAIEPSARLAGGVPSTKGTLTD